MMMTDPVADMLTRLRNASMAGNPTTTIPASRLKIAMARILKDTGFVEDFKVEGEPPRRNIVVRLKYLDDNEPVIAGLKRVSKPSRRVYRGYKDIPRVLGGLGVVIMSTSRGLMTGREAFRRHLGGEVLAYVW